MRFFVDLQIYRDMNTVVFQEVEIDGIGKLHPAESQLAKLGLISLALSLSRSLARSLWLARGGSGACM